MSSSQLTANSVATVTALAVNQGLLAGHLFCPCRSCPPPIIGFSLLYQLGACIPIISFSLLYQLLSDLASWESPIASLLSFSMHPLACWCLGHVTSSGLVFRTGDFLTFVYILGLVFSTGDFLIYIHIRIGV